MTFWRLYPPHLTEGTSQPACNLPRKQAENHSNVLVRTGRQQREMRGARNRPLGENGVLLRVAQILIEKARPFKIIHSISSTGAPSVDWLLLGSVFAPNQ